MAFLYYKLQPIQWPKNSLCFGLVWGSIKWCYLVEEEGSARGPREARGDELRAVGQRRVTVGAAEQPSAADVVQKDPSHVLNHLVNV